MGASTFQGALEIDNDSGYVRYAVARRGITFVPTESGSLAVISFRIPQDSRTGDFNLVITKAAFSDENFAKIELEVLPQVQLRVE